MLKTSLNVAVLAALSALAAVPTLAHATLVKTTATTSFDVSNSVTDTLAVGRQDERHTPANSTGSGNERRTPANSNERRRRAVQW